jgi:hypothetical protein
MLKNTSEINLAGMIVKYRFALFKIILNNKNGENQDNSSR